MAPSLSNFKDSFFAAQLTSLINLCSPSYQAVLPCEKYVKIYRCIVYKYRTKGSKCILKFGRQIRVLSAGSRNVVC